MSAGENRVEDSDMAVFMAETKELGARREVHGDPDRIALVVIGRIGLYFTRRRFAALRRMDEVPLAPADK